MDRSAGSTTPVEPSDVNAGSSKISGDAEKDGASPVEGQTSKPVGSENQSGPPPAFDFPDGGLKAWATVAGAWLALFSSFGYVNAFGVYQEYYQAYYLTDKSSSSIAWIGSFQLFLMFAMSVVTGKLFDEGYYRYLLISGTIIYCVCIQMVSLAKSYYSIFLSQGLGMGIGIGLLFLPSVGAVSHHFRRRRALATGIVVSGSSVGGVVFPIMLNQLFHGKAGFAWGVRASGFVILGCLIGTNLLITTRLPPRKQRPAHLQVAPDMKGIVTDVPYIICNVGLFFVILGVFYPFFYLQIFASEKGLSRTISFYSLSILNAASIFGRVLPNFLADAYGPLNLVIPCLTICGAMTFVFLACGSTGGIIGFAIVFGFFSGAYVSLLPSIQAGFARNVQEIGVRLGLPFTLLSIGALVGTPISGALVGQGHFAWWKGSLFSGVVIFFGTFLVIVARMMQTRRKHTQKV